MYGYDVLHEDIIENLITNVRNAKGAHAYIFEGENGVGSYQAAQLLASALVCQNQSTAPCTACSSCIKAKADTHPDILYISAESGKRAISVDRIRELSKEVYKRPFESAKKVLIIDGEMNEQAQNAFLKMLEEPPEYAVFIILAQNSEALLQTIRSRCMLVHFAPVSDGKIREYLKKNFPEDEDKLDFLVRYSGGIAGNAKKFLAQENFMELRHIAFDKLSALMSANLAASYDIAAFLEENKEDADLIFEFWLDFVRDIILIQNGARELVQNSDLLDRMINAANRIDEKQMVCACEQLVLTQKMRTRYVNLRAAALRLAFTIKQNGVK